MLEKISVASVCRSLPNPDDSSSGVFVLRRLAALAKQTSLTAIQPIPYFPMLVPTPAWARETGRKIDDLEVEHASMFYVPRYLKSLDGAWLYRSIMHGLRHRKASGKLDIVDAHFGYPEGVGAFMAARKLGVPAVVTLRGFEAEYLRKPLIGDQIRYAIRRADRCICVSHSLRDIAISEGVSADRTVVIHNAIDTDLFFPGSQSSARQVLGLDEAASVVVSVGHLIKRKRHHILISAFARLLANNSGARLIIIGDKTFGSDYYSQLQKQVAELGIQQAVEFPGNIDAGRVANYLRAADVFALGTQREGCCNAVLEALACGVPVVTTPAGDNSWFVKDGQNGYIVPIDDIDAMEVALIETMQRADWNRTQISEGLGVGNWTRVATEVKSVFESVLQAQQHSTES